MGLLSREDILKKRELPKELVEVPEWGGSVWVRTLSGDERDDYEKSLVSGKRVDLSNARAKLVARVCVKEDGEQMFSERDAGQLGRQSSKALDRVFAVGQRLSGISDGDIEELVKNSGTGQNDNSTSV